MGGLHQRGAGSVEGTAVLTAYYNEIDPYAAQWLRNLISAGHIAPGDVDERSIIDVQPEDLKSYSQCHFFAGIGGWSLAARLAGWPDDRPLWTGSCPCQPFSVAGKGEGQKDKRHLWPEYFRLIAARAPAVVMGEQVAAAVGKDWLDGVCVDLEGIGYTVGATVVPACAVDAPHRRDRLWFVADAPYGGRGEERQNGRGVDAGDSQEGRAAGFDAGNSPIHVADAQRINDDGRRFGAGHDGRKLIGSSELRGGQRDGGGNVAHADKSGPQGRSILRQRGNQRTTWSDGLGSARGADGKARRIEPSIRLLAHGVPGRVGQLRAYGNAIVPQVAAEVIAAYLDATA